MTQVKKPILIGNGTWGNPLMRRSFHHEDTYEGGITNLLSLNLYTYVENNPLKYVDPSGHYKESDNDTLKALVNPYTDQWNNANNMKCADYACKKYVKDQKMAAQKSADAVRVSYYSIKGLSLPC
jgi:hypothetical protein